MRRDWFGESYVMKIDGGDASLQSYMGSLCSILIMMLILIYSYMKADVLINKKDVDILSVIN